MLVCIVLISSVQSFSEEVNDYMELAVVDNTRRYDSLAVERQPTGIVMLILSKVELSDNVNLMLFNMNQRNVTE